MSTSRCTHPADASLLSRRRGRACGVKVGQHGKREAREERHLPVAADSLRGPPLNRNVRRPEGL